MRCYLYALRSLLLLLGLMFLVIIHVHGEEEANGVAVTEVCFILPYLIMLMKSLILHGLHNKLPFFFNSILYYAQRRRCDFLSEYFFFFFVKTKLSIYSMRFQWAFWSICLFKKQHPQTIHTTLVIVFMLHVNIELCCILMWWTGRKYHKIMNIFNARYPILWNDPH